MQWRKVVPTPVMSRDYCHGSKDKPPRDVKKKNKVQLLGAIGTQFLQEQRII